MSAPNAQTELDRKPFRIGDWVAYPSRNQLQRDGKPVDIEPRMMAVLVHLAQRPNEVVSAGELITAVWRDNFEGENPVYRCISLLRSVLEDSARDPKYIQTVPTKGYRLICPVVPLEAPEPPSHAPQDKNRKGLLAAFGGALIVASLGFGALFAYLLTTQYFDSDTTNSVAVLPFDNLSEPATADYLADGLSEGRIEYTPPDPRPGSGKPFGILLIQR